MAGAERLKQKILEEASLKAQANLEKAEKEASEIMKAAKEEADNKRQMIIAKAEQEAEERKRRLIAAAELDSRKERLKTKQEIINEAFTKAIQNIIELPAIEYEKILVDMTAESITRGDEEIIMCDNDKERLSRDFIKSINEKIVQKGLKGNVKLSKETRSYSSGIIIKTGDVEINNSIEAIIRMQRDKIEAEIVKVLF